MRTSRLFRSARRRPRNGSTSLAELPDKATLTYRRAWRPYRSVGTWFSGHPPPPPPPPAQLRNVPQSGGITSRSPGSVHASWERGDHASCEWVARSSTIGRAGPGARARSGRPGYTSVARYRVASTWVTVQRPAPGGRSHGGAGWRRWDRLTHASARPPRRSRSMTRRPIRCVVALILVRAPKLPLIGSPLHRLRPRSWRSLDESIHTLSNSCT